jgi:hypothetical protein
MPAGEQLEPATTAPPEPAPEPDLLATDVAEDARPSPLRDLVIGVVLFGLAVVLSLFRQQGVRSWDTVEGEDGFLLYQQAITDGGWQVLLREYQGYLQLPIRVLAIPMEWMPTRALAPYAAWTGAVVTALLAWFVYAASRQWVSSKIVRVALAALVVFMPTGGIEATGNLTNTIWTFAAVTPWAIVSLNERGREVTVRCIVAFLGVTATAIALVFAPLVIAWVLIRRTKAALSVALAYGVGALLQLLTMHTASSPLNTIPAERPLDEMIVFTAVRVFTTHLGGPELASRWWHEHGNLSALLGFLVITGLFAAALVGAGRRAQLAGVVFYATAVGVMVALIGARGTDWLKYLLETFEPLQHLRYNIVSTLALASAFAVLLACFGPTRDRTVGRIGRPLFVAHVALLIIVTVTVTSYRSESPVWSDSVAKAVADCERAAPDDFVLVRQDALGWQNVRIRCADLRR